MTSTQMFKAIQYLSHINDVYDVEGWDGTAGPTDTINEQYRNARHHVEQVLTICNPCPVCSGSGIDPAKPYNVAKIVTEPPTCDACEGHGFQVEDGHGAVDALLAERLAVFGYVS